MAIDNFGFDTFLRAATENERDSLVEYKEFAEYMEQIEGIFVELRAEKIETGPLSGMLFLNAHACLLGAARIAFSGQSPPTFMVLRGAIESSLYALIASQSTDNTNIWLNRTSDPKRCKNLYRASNGIALLNSDPNLREAISNAYEHSIEFGAHPNLRSILPYVKIETPNEKGQPIGLTYLNSINSVETLRSITACIETGILVLLMSPHVFPQHPIAAQMHARAAKILAEFQGFLVKRGNLAEFTQDQVN
jgi:hypothetical protein